MIEQPMDLFTSLDTRREYPIVHHSREEKNEPARLVYPEEKNEPARLAYPEEKNEPARLVDLRSGNAEEMILSAQEESISDRHRAGDHALLHVVLR